MYFTGAPNYEVLMIMFGHIASGAKDKQATQRGAEQTSNSHQRDAGWVFFRR